VRTRRRRSRRTGGRLRWALGWLTVGRTANLVALAGVVVTALGIALGLVLSQPHPDPPDPVPTTTGPSPPATTGPKVRATTTTRRPGTTGPRPTDPLPTTTAPPPPPPSRPPPSRTTVTAPRPAEILSPADGEKVHTASAAVSGIAPAPADPSNELWVLVENEQRRWWAYRVAPTASGSWSGKVGVGPGEVNRDLPFRLILAELSPSAQARVARAMAEAGYNDKGMARFTAGVRQLDRISVVRSN
jgi:hypothetical protein